jgi:hypothetical protein
MKIPNDVIRKLAEVAAQSDLGDPRRSRRLAKFTAQLARNPSGSLPAALGDDASLQGAYRLLNNDEVDFEAILAPHRELTYAQAARAREVLVVHDTTDCSFPRLDPKDIGYLQTGKAGFRLHLSLILDAATWRRPLGIGHAEPFWRTHRSRKKGRRKRSGAATAAQPDREFCRWWRGIAAIEAALPPGTTAIHVADREGDSYELFAQLEAAHAQHVIRQRVDRRGRDVTSPATEWSTVRQVASRSEGLLEREVPLSRRAKKPTPAMNKSHPPRKQRVARLRFAATTVVIPRPRYLRDPLPAQLTLNLVHVTEVDPPAGEPPVEWLLYTSLPIDTPEQVATIVDHYRSRWTIEEYNAALKTGCAYEQREFTTRHALLNLLAATLPIACQILWLRSRARTEPSAPAAEVLTVRQIEVLRSLSPRKPSDQPTAEEVMLSVAALGGHLKRNGSPGWLVLYRGMAQLLAYEVGWSAAMASRRRGDL